MGKPEGLTVSVKRLGLRGALKGLPGKATDVGLGEYFFCGCFFKNRCSRQYPGVCSSRFTYQDPLVIWIKSQNPVVAIERAEEADPQFCIAAAGNRQGSSFGGNDCAVCLAAAIDYLHHVTFLQVSGLGVSSAGRLKAVGKSGDLVPCSHVAIEIDSIDRRQWLQSSIGTTAQTEDQGKEAWERTADSPGIPSPRGSWPWFFCACRAGVFLGATAHCHSKWVRIFFARTLIGSEAARGNRATCGRVGLIG